MNAKTLFLLLLLIVGAGGLYLAVAGGGSGPAPDPLGEQRNDGVEDPEAVDPLRVDDAAPKPVPQARVERNPVRRAVDQTQVDPRSFEQGVFGRCVDASGTPVEGVEVFLVEGQSKNIFSIMMQAQRGVVIPPVARTRSDRLGQFELGLQKVLPDKTYELRFISERFADASKPNITMFDSDWVDVGDVSLALGATVFGRVTVDGANGLPIANAEVSVKPPSTFPSLSPTPGRERGIVAFTDAGGHFRLQNVKPGIATIAAVAPGFAKIERQNVEISKDSETQLRFELPKGLSIAGVVTDSEGQVVPGAKITAIAISSKTPITEETRTDSEGRFEVIGLTAGPFQVTAAAPGFVKCDVKPVQAGVKAEHIVLERQGSARIKVVAKSGRLIQRYDVVLKSYFKEQENYGNVPNAQVHRVFASNLDNDGFYTVSGIDPAEYVFQVQTKGFAKSFSEPFTVALRKDPESIVVTLSEGGKIEGVVYGYDGRPLRGATVTTLPNFLDENPFTAMFGDMIPYKITRVAQVTDGNGHYEIPMLAPGTYQLKFTHPEHCDDYQKNYTVAEGRSTRIPDLRMDRGTVISGTVHVDGRPGGQVKVSISAAPDPSRPGQVGFSADAITDNEGRFTINKRLPPGRYQARAARQTLASPLLQVVDFAKTQQDFAVSKGQERHSLHFTLSSDN